MRKKLKICLTLFWVFFRIGAFTFGGGYAMIPLISEETVNKRKWISESDILDIIAIAESTPGPVAINSATFVGYRVAGFWGAFFSTLGVVLPSFIIVLLLCKVYEAWKNHPIFRGVMSGLKPAVIGLIGTAAVTLATPENFIDWKSYAICIVAFTALYFKKVGPFAIIGLGALAGLILY